MTGPPEPTEERTNQFVDDPARQCHGKSWFLTKADARRWWKRNQTKYGGSTQRNTEYKCPHCGYWHYGRRPTQQERDRAIAEQEQEHG